MLGISQVRAISARQFEQEMPVGAELSAEILFCSGGGATHL